MPGSVLEQLPDLGEIGRVKGDAELGLTTAIGGLDALGTDSEASPLSALVSGIGNVQLSADIDLSGITERLPEALDTVIGAIPPSALEFVEDIQGAYDSAEAFLRDHPIARQVTEGRTLQQVALAVIEDALARFDDELEGLARGILGEDALDAIRDGLDAIERFRTDFQGNADEFLPFLAEQLIGVAPDILSGPLEHVEATLSVLAKLDDAALAPARRALADAAAELTEAIDDLDPAVAAGYTRVTSALDALDDEIRSLAGALAGELDGALSAITGYDWESIASGLTDAFDSVPTIAVRTVDDWVEAVTGLLDGLLGQLGMIIDDAELPDRVDGLVQGIDDMVATSGLAAARGAVHDALAEVLAAIQGIDTGAVQEAVEDMLGRIKEELEALDLDGIVDDLEQAFDDVAKAVEEHFTDDVLGTIAEGIDTVLKAFDELPVSDLTQLLSASVEQLKGAIASLEELLEGRMDDVNGLLSQLDDLSFTPLADEVIAEIDDVRERLDAIDPSSLSEVERLAIRTALAVLEAIDLEDTVIREAKQGFREARGAVDDVLAELQQLLDRLRGHLREIDPREVFATADELLGQAEQAVRAINGTKLVAPLKKEVDTLAKQVAALDPERIFEPLEKPYGELMAAVGRLDPDEWVEPLRTLYAEIDRVIGLVDVTPVFQALDQKRRDLLTQARTGLLDALADLDLPGPLDVLLDAVRPFIEQLTAALFDDPQGKVRELALDIPKSVDLATPLRVLDEPFDALFDMAAKVPDQALTEAAEALRRGIGVALDVIDPDALLDAIQGGLGRLAGLAPPVVAGPALALPALRATVTARLQAAPPERAGDAAALDARIAASVALVADDSTVIAPVTAKYEALHTEFAQRVEAVDLEPVRAAYGRVRDEIDGLVPDFLRRLEPLTHDDVLAGFAGLRPSAQAHRLEEPVRRFLTRLQPLATEIDDATDRLFAAFRRTLALIDPLQLEDVIGQIFAAVREQVHVLDPDALADSAQDLLDELTAPLATLDPAKVAQRLGAAFDRAIAAIQQRLNEFLDDVAKAIDARLKVAREAVAQTLKDVRAAVKLAGDALGGVAEQFDQLVFVDLLARFDRVLDSLNSSFDRELDRTRAAFDAMLAAIPVGGGGATVGGAVGGGGGG